MNPHSDVIVIGAGILGLAHAAVAAHRGLRVTVLERDAFAAGASVRNFGHVCATAQPVEHQALAQRSRAGWLATAQRYRIPILEHGTLVLADRPEAEAVLAELADARPDEVRMRTAAQVSECLDGLATDSVVAGAHLPADLRVDPRETAGQLARALGEDGVDFRWRHQVHAIEDRGDRAEVRTNRGTFVADRVICCVGHDLDLLAADIADSQRVRRCRLSMMRLAPMPIRIHPALLTVTSMLRYGAFGEAPSFPALRARVHADQPELVDLANVMATQLPDGSLILGDSHDYDLTVSPFQKTGTEIQLFDEMSRLLRIEQLRVTERWQGVYADSSGTDIVDVTPSPLVRFITVTSGIGMTLSFGLAERTFGA